MFRSAARLPTPRFGVSALSLRVALDGHTVLRDVELELRPGEILAVVGPNGAGKSTLLGALAGDLALEAGSIAIDGADLESWSPVELAMRRSVLPQQVSISFPFTVADVVAMGRAPWAGTQLEDRDADAVAEALAAADITDLADRPHTHLSGGERARVTLARVLAQEARVLLLDEPTATLDLRHQELVMGVARGLASSGCAILVVVHDLGLAAAHADRVLLLELGRVAAIGSPVEVLTPDLLSTVYQTRVDVIRHPRSGQLLVLPWRSEARVWGGG